MPIHPSPEPLWLAINVAGAGDNTLLAGVADTQYRVIAVQFVVAGAVTVAWKSATTTLIPAMSFAASGDGLTFNGDYFNYWVNGGTNEVLILNLGGAVQVSGRLLYHAIG